MAGMESWNLCDLSFGVCFFKYIYIFNLTLKFLENIFFQRPLSSAGQEHFIWEKPTLINHFLKKQRTSAEREPWICLLKDPKSYLICTKTMYYLL